MRESNPVARVAESSVDPTRASVAGQHQLHECPIFSTAWTETTARASRRRLGSLSPHVGDSRSKSEPQPFHRARHRQTCQSQDMAVSSDSRPPSGNPARFSWVNPSAPHRYLVDKPRAASREHSGGPTPRNHQQPDQQDNAEVTIGNARILAPTTKTWPNEGARNWAS